MLKKCFLPFVFLCFIHILTGSLVFAETNEIITEATYNMGDGETPMMAEERALLLAKRIAVEQAGTYIESYSKVNNLKLTEDEIRVLAAGSMKVTILDKQRKVSNDGSISVYVKIKALVTPEQLSSTVGKLKDAEFIQTYRQMQDNYTGVLKKTDNAAMDDARVSGDLRTGTIRLGTVDSGSGQVGSQVFQWKKVDGVWLRIIETIPSISSQQTYQGALSQQAYTFKVKLIGTPGTKFQGQYMLSIYPGIVTAKSIQGTVPFETTVTGSGIRCSFAKYPGPDELKLEMYKDNTLELLSNTNADYGIVSGIL